MGFSITKHLLRRKQKKLIYLAERFPQYDIGVGSYSSDLEVLTWGEGATLKIGNYCSIAEGVKIFLGGEHRTDWVTTYPFNVLWREAKHIKGSPKAKGDITIGSDVWIGREAVILSGVTIGHGAVVGARSVVSKDVPPYAIVAGNPSKIVRFRFDDKTIQSLLDIEWWKWDKDRIVRNMDLLLSDNVGELIRKNDAY